MGNYTIDKDQGKVAVVAGEFKGVKGPAKTFSPINIYVIDLENKGHVSLDEPGNFNTGLLILEGDLKVNGSEGSEKDFFLFEDKEGSIRLEAQSERAKLIVLSGEPINEPIVTGGPFVMNTQEEINQAAKDFREGRFGSLDF